MHRTASRNAMRATPAHNDKCFTMLLIYTTSQLHRRSLKARALEIQSAGPAIPNAIHLHPAALLCLECVKLALALIAHIELERWRFAARPSCLVRAHPHGNPFNRLAPRCFIGRSFVIIRTGEGDGGQEHCRKQRKKGWNSHDLNGQEHGPILCQTLESSSS